MIFVAHALDKSDALERRLAALDAHRGYLDEAPTALGVKVLMSGPLLDDEGQLMVGSFFLLSAKSREDVEHMVADDPIAKAGVWQKLTISRVHLRQNSIGTIGEQI